MYQIKHFRTYQDQQDWITKNEDRYWITVLFVNNGYAVEYKKLRRVY